MQVRDYKAFDRGTREAKPIFTIMSMVSEQSGNDDCENLQFENGLIKKDPEDSGWNDRIEDSDQLFKLIKIINSKISLSVLFERYKIQFETYGSASGWTHRCKCPFPDHNDKTPSFGYNSEQNRFNCFGCHRSGSTVEFLSFVESISLPEAAKYLVKKTNLNYLVLKEVNNFDPEHIYNILYEFADFIMAFKTKFKTDMAFQYAEDICWGLDLYIQKNITDKSIDVNELKTRILKLKCQFDLFEDN